VANRKQRRRREKEKRHDYEIVEIDDEGNETVVAGPALRPESEGNGKGRSSGRGRSSAKGKASNKGRGSVSGSRGGRSDRGARGIAQEPSWGRVIRRGGMFAPVFFVIVYLLAGDGMTLTGIVIQTLLLLVIFVPFSYLMDRFMWRTQQRRIAKQRDGPA
jgi:hypothetical protein